MAAKLYDSPMEPRYFGVVFSKGGVYQNERFRVFIELDHEDKALLRSNMSAELKTQFIVWHAGVLHLLPFGIDDSWHQFGRIVDCDIENLRDVGIEPTAGKDKHRIWIIQAG